MAVKTKAQLLTEITSSFPTTPGAITAAVVRAHFTNCIDTMFEVSANDVQVVCAEYASDVIVRDGAAYVQIGQRLANKNLTFLHARVITAGAGGPTAIQVQRIRGGIINAMLSNELNIDASEVGSDTATTPAVVNIPDVQLHDTLRIDITSVPATKPKGLIVTLGFTT